MTIKSASADNSQPNQIHSASIEELNVVQHYMFGGGMLLLIWQYSCIILREFTKRYDMRMQSTRDS